jgi:hypothetical protein
MKEAVVIGAYTDTIEKELTLIKTILEWKKHNIPIILTTHYPINERIQNLVDYYIFDKAQHMEERLTVNRWYKCDSFNITARATKPYHAAAGLIAFQNAIRSIGDKFDFIYLLDYDVELNIPEVLTTVRSFHESHFEIFMFNWKGDPESYATNVCFFKQGAFNKIWGDIQSVEDYLQLISLTRKNNIANMFIERLARDLIYVKNLQDNVYIFDNVQTQVLMGNFSEHSADINDPGCYLTTVLTGEAILFLVNPTPTTKLFKLQIQNLITGQQEEQFQGLNGGTGMYWKLFNNNTYLKVSCDNLKKEYYINSFNNFNECKFEFFDGTPIFMKT